ncbi:hypothetical protein [Salinispora arenicola]|uniref:hypothetical protein n=1 Tax=Salinispora arenicola TaxID=168697 RepID=UPI0003A9D2B7|nr:hypothetical protein [Salinispora arenicola]MCN0178012.1 hypothetical protein [Salinispora arenicola]NIL56072.1 hypothetical protein [Salinispora arenicola]NIL60779.1 hypothetical protein [Salinispora arenicola]
MSETTPGTPEEATDAPAGRLRLLPPAVSFAGRAAALARVGLPVALLTASIAAPALGADAGEATMMHTTCCPDRPL